MASHYQIKYNMTTQPPLMVFWTEANATLRASAYNKEGGIDGGTVSFQKKKAPIYGVVLTRTI